MVENITTSPYNLAIARGGNAEAKITLIIAFTSASDVTEVKFGKAGQEIRISGAIVATDNLTIDGENQRVLKNGNPV